MFSNLGQNLACQPQMYCQINGTLFAITPLPRQPGMAWPNSGCGQEPRPDFQISFRCEGCQKLLFEQPPPSCRPVPGPTLPLPGGCRCGPAVEWVPTNSDHVHTLSDRAVVAGYEKHNGSALWVIRAKFEGNLIPGKLVLNSKTAYFGWDGQEHSVNEFEVCCARPERIMWQESRNGNVPPNAIVAGKTLNGEPLYVGRAFEEGSLTPGKVHPSYQTLFLPFYGKEVSHKEYEVLCAVNVVHLCNCANLY